MNEEIRSVFKTGCFYLMALIMGISIELSALLKVDELWVKVPVFVYIIVFCVTAVLLAVVFGFLHRFLRDYRKEHFLVWFLKDHSIGIVSFCGLLGFFIGSIHKDLILDRELVAELIGIEWAIFAISVGVFAVWRGLMFERVFSDEDLESLKKEEESIKNESDRYLFLKKKKRLRRKYISSFAPAVFISINTLVLCLATGMCFLLKDYCVESENVAFFAAFCCTLTLILVLEVVVLDLWAKRKDFIDKTQVSPVEMNESLDNFVCYEFLDLLDRVDKDNKLRTFTSEDAELNKAVNRSIQLLEEYRKDSSSASKNKDELVSLFYCLVDTFKEMDRKAARKAKKIARLEKKIERIKGK